MANTYYVDYQDGLDTNDGKSFANRKKTLASIASANLAGGDSIRLIASPGYGNVNVSATWTLNSNIVTLASAVNILLYDGNTAWTANGTGAAVTCTTNSTFRRSVTNSAQVAVTAGFTTGQLAYFPLPATTDCSAYQGLSFWFLTNTIQNTQNLSIHLCSDAAGNTTVSSAKLPKINVAGLWVPLYLDTKASLGAGINSVAIYADNTPGATQFLLQNINTVPSSNDANNLNITSLINNGVANDGWWALRSINATSLYIDADPSMALTTIVQGWHGNTTTGTILKIDPIPTINNLASISTTTLPATVLSTSGLSSNYIQITGGWDRVGMTTQTQAISFFDGMNAVGEGWNNTSKNYYYLDMVGFTRYSYGMFQSLSTSSFGNVWISACHSFGVSVTFVDANIDRIVCAGCGHISGGAGINFNTSAGTVRGYTLANTLIAYGSTYSGFGGFYISGTCQSIRIGTMISGFNTGSGLWLGGTLSGAHIDSAIFNNNGVDGIDESTLGILYQVTISRLECSRNGRMGATFDVFMARGGVNIEQLYAANNIWSGVYLGTTIGRNYIGKLVTQGNSPTLTPFSSVNSTDLCQGGWHILQSSVNEANVIAFGATTTNKATPGYVVFRNFNGTVGDHREYWHNNTATISSVTDVRHTASGIAWKFDINDAMWTYAMPLKRRIAAIAVQSGTVVTANVWAYRDSLNVLGTLAINGNQIEGVVPEVASSMAGAINTWENVQVTFTPSANGIVECEWRVYPNTANGAANAIGANCWIDDFYMSQA